MLVDNASSHKSKKVAGALSGFGGDAVLEYFPPRAPELNPAEARREGTGHGTSNVLHGSTGEMREPVRAMLGNGEAKAVQVVQYLTP